MFIKMIYIETLSCALSANPQRVTIIAAPDLKTEIKEIC